MLEGPGCSVGLGACSTARNMEIGTLGDAELISAP